MKKLVLFLMATTFAFSSNAIVRSVHVDPLTTALIIRNMANFAYDYNNFQLTINGNYYNLSNQNITSGDLNAGVDEEIHFSGIMFPSAASVGIWYPGTFPSMGAPSPSNLVDFFQYGSAGHEYEDVAQTAGIWTVGDFVSGTPPFTFTGGATDYGTSFWQNSGSTGVEDIVSFHGGIHAFPNPFQADLSIIYDPEFGGKDEPVQLTLTDINGKAVRTEELEENEAMITDEGLADGVYFLRLTNAKGETLIKKVMHRD